MKSLLFLMEINGFEIQTIQNVLTSHHITLTLALLVEVRTNLVTTALMGFMG